MKQILTIFLAFFFLNLSAQVVTVGTGTVKTSGVPINFYYGYTYCQSLYLASDINQTAGGNIHRITYKGASSLNNTDNWTVYVGNTTKNSFSLYDDWVTIADLTQVFTGEVSINPNNTITIEFTTPFNYTGGNLVIAVDENTPGYANTINNLFATSASGNRSLSYYNDSTNPDPTSPPEGNYISYIPSIDIDFNAAACNEFPTDLAVNNVTDATANLTWTAGGSIANWNVQYGPSGFTLGDGTSVNVGTNAFNASGLNANTAYDFYVQTNCGSGLTSAWVGPYTFTTNCAPFSATYTQNFDTSSEIDACWKTDILNSTSTNGSSIRIYNQYNYSSPHSLYLTTSYDDAGTYYIISPKFSDLDNSKRIKMQIRKDMGNAYTATLELGKLTDNTDYSTYTTIQTIDLNSLTEDTWEELIIPLTSLSGTGGYIVLKFNQGSTNEDWNNRLYFDDFVYESTPACLKPTNLTTSNLTGLVSIDLGWTANNAETVWEIQYGVSPYTQGNGTTITVTDNPYTLTDIEENTTYDFYVKANCSNAESGWSNMGSFTTSDLTTPMEGAVGINTETPKTALDVKGSIRMLNRNDNSILYECTEETEGAMGYDIEDKKMKVCTDEGSNGYAWKAIQYE